MTKKTAILETLNLKVQKLDKKVSLLISSTPKLSKESIKEQSLVNNCSNQELADLRIKILASDRYRPSDEILNNPCLPNKIKETYKDYLRLQSKLQKIRAQLEEKYCTQHADGCSNGKIINIKEEYKANWKEEREILTEREKTDEDFKIGESGNYILYENFKNNLDAFLTGKI